MKPILTDRLDIRLVTLDDIDDIFEYVSNPHTMRFERSEFKNKKELQKAMDYFIKNKGQFVLREKDTDKVIGQVTLTITSPTINNEYNLGYVLHEDYQGKGYCTEACKAVIKYGFEVKKMHRVKAACDPKNTSSWKVMERLGMRKEAHFINKICFRNDEKGKPIFTDQYVYAINIEDFQK